MCTRVSDDRKYVCGRRLYACINTRKFKGLDSREITPLPEIKKVIYMARHFNHRLKYTACSSQDAFAYNERPSQLLTKEKGRDESFQVRFDLPFLPTRLTAPGSPRMQFPRSPLGTPGTMTLFCVLNTEKKGQKNESRCLRKRD